MMSFYEIVQLYNKRMKDKNHSQKKLKLILFLVIQVLFLNTFSQEYAIIPKPNSISYAKGAFSINSETAISSEIESLGIECREFVKNVTGFTLKIQSSNQDKENVISLSIDNLLKVPTPEGYFLKIDETGIHLTGKSERGLFYGFQTLKQIIGPVAKDGNKVKPLIYVEIRDFPNYPWRGLMLDVSRHFYTPESIKQFIDYLAFHKMNIFHWHLVDNQGWRVEIKKYPELTNTGAWRADMEDRHWRLRPWPENTDTALYGGFYTQEQIKEIVKYARERQVDIVPEIEMPAHVYSALAAYPEYSCFNHSIQVPSGANWPNYEIYCAGKDATFNFLEDVLSEIMTLFPYEYIHIGGDEADYTQWKSCNDCQNRIKKEGLKDEKELQSYFIKRINRFLNKHNKKLIGWDEILYGGMPKGATMMYWRGWHKDAPQKAIEEGNNVIMTQNGYCYFNYYQGDREHEPLSRKFTIPISKVYHWNVLPENIAAENQKFILGGQANLWGEYIHSPEIAQEMVFPRLAALSETLWTRENEKDWKDFCSRIPGLFSWYNLMEMSYSKAIFIVRVNSRTDSLNPDRIIVGLSSEYEGGEIRYTLDGSAPSKQSELYNAELTIDKDVTLRAGTFLNGELMGNETSRSYSFHKAYRKEVNLANQYSEKYTAGGVFGLCDGIFGTKNPRDGKWQGFDTKDFEAVISFDKLTTVKEIETRFLQSATDGIYLPLEVQLLVSEDGITFTEAGKIINEVSPALNADTVKSFSFDVSELRVKSIKVKAINRKVSPPSSLKEMSAWLFVDEIKIQ